jgi:dephospho-CoA kinase
MEAMTLVALTGGIGAGKSTIAQRLSAHGAHVFDADEFARQVVRAGEQGLEQIRERFGPSVISDDGSLDRSALGRIVFGDEQALRDLEAITHPAIQALARQTFSAIQRSDPDAVIVYEIPLFVETGAETSHWDEIIVADAPAEMRIARLEQERGLDRSEAERRVKKQATDAQRREVATQVIDTSRSIQDTLEQVDRLWERLQRPRS